MDNFRKHKLNMTVDNEVLFYGQQSLSRITGLHPANCYKWNSLSKSQNYLNVLIFTSCCLQIMLPLIIITNFENLSILKKNKVQRFTAGIR